IVVAPCHSGNEPERRSSLHREVGVGAKRGSKPPHRRTGAKVRYDSDEVAAVGIEKPEQRRVTLTAGFAAVAPDGLKRCHQPDVVTPTPGRLGIHHAPLLASPKKWRLFIDEGDKSDGERGLKRLEHSGYFQQRSNATGIVIGSRTANDRVIVRTQEQNLVATCAPLTCGDKVCAANSGDVVLEPLYAIAESAPFSVDIGCRTSKCLGIENIALANFFGKRCDMSSKSMREELIVVAHCHSLTFALRQSNNNQVKRRQRVFAAPKDSRN